MLKLIDPDKLMWLKSGRREESSSFDKASKKMSLMVVE